MFDRGFPGCLKCLFTNFPFPSFHFCKISKVQSTMDPQNRRTASTYINNLLLSRGLLRNAMPIDFATPGNVEGGLDATMGQVMTLVHDLILRRDVCPSSLKCIKLHQHTYLLATVARVRHIGQPLSQPTNPSHCLNPADAKHHTPRKPQCRPR